MTSVDLFRHGKDYPNFGLLEPALRNWKYMPPLGGWAVTVLINGVKGTFNSDPLSIAESIFTSYKGANQPVGLDVIFNFLNHTWLSRDPSRALVEIPEMTQRMSPKPKFTAKDLFISWLGTYASRFDDVAWKGAVSHISELTDPANQLSTADADFFEKITKARIDSTPTSGEEVTAWLRKIS